MPLPLTVSCFSKIQIGFTFLVPAHLGSPWKRAVKRVCVCVWHQWLSCLNTLFLVDCWQERKHAPVIQKGSFWILGLLCQHFGFVIFGTINLCVYVYVCMYCRREGAAMARAGTVTVCIDWYATNTILLFVYCDITEKAFFDPSLLELLYFPEDQK